MRQLFFARLYFCLQESPLTAKKLIEHQRQTALRWLADLEERSRVSEAASGFETTLQQYRKRQVDMILSWLDSCQAELDGRLKAK
jgi:hypothetical protein